MTIVLIGLAKGRGAVDHDEEDDSKREQISFPDIEEFRLVHLRRHVPVGPQQASVGSEPVILNLVAEAKVDQFQVASVVEDDVFEFEVAVRNAARVDVGEPAEELLKEKATRFF